tara:strand:- start:26 stop:169 length:144 start_codon:yes stop_codon:yes gene_type:complete
MREGYYRLIWKGEVIEDYIPNFEEASYLASEYELAFNANNIKIRYKK